MTASGGPEPAIRFERVVHQYGARRAVDGVTLEIPHGEFAILLGPSGCGKTTLLKTVNRLLEATEGSVVVDGTDVATTDPVALRRRIGYAIQQVGLFPHMSVAENVAVVPHLVGWPRERIATRVDELLDLVHLAPNEFRARHPRELSGGQQQRVGLARALAADPGILLMDEPFGAVDAIERAHLQDEMLGIQQRLKKTVLFVTHDVEEALRLGDRIVVMRDGRVVQSGSPADVLCAPADRFVAALLGADDALRRLSVLVVRSAMDAADSMPANAMIAATASLRDALSLMASTGERRLMVDADGDRIGVISLDRVLGAARATV